MAELNAKLYKISQPAEYALDSVKRTKTRVFFGRIADAEGNTIQSQADTKKEIQKRVGDKGWDAEIARRTRVITFNFEGVTVEQLIDQHITSTTVEKQWYNSQNVATWTEEEVEKFLADHPKGITLRVQEDVLSTIGRKAGGGKKKESPAEFMARRKAEGASKKDILAELADMLDELEDGEED